MSGVSTNHRRNDQPSLADVPGWQLWNMSKRVADVRIMKKKADLWAEEAPAHQGFTDADRSQLRILHAELGATAVAADHLYERLRAEVSAGQPEAIEEPRHGIDVLRNAGSNPELTARLKAIWASDRSIARAWEIFEALKRLLRPYVDVDDPTWGEIRRRDSK